MVIFWLTRLDNREKAINIVSVPRAKLMPSGRSLSVNGRGQQALLKMIISLSLSHQGSQMIQHAT